MAVNQMGIPQDKKQNDETELVGKVEAAVAEAIG